MLLDRDARIVIFVSVVGMVTALSVSFSATERIRNWQNEFALSAEDPVFFSSSLFLEHNRLLQAIAGFVRGDAQISKADVLERLDIYWSRFQLLNSSKHIFDTPEVTHTMTWLPEDSHSQDLEASLEAISQEFMPALLRIEQQIKELHRGDYRAYVQARAGLDAYGDSLARLQIVSFERQRYLDDVQVALSEELRSQLRNALIGLSVGIMLLSYLLMLYLRHRHNATEKLRDINDQLHIEVLESERLAQELSFQATHDSLTGLMNRFGFNKALEEQLVWPQGNHGLCFVDLDLFKVVNDTCGHAAGDELICEISNLLRRSLPDNTIVARFGGDEFVILLCDCEQTVFENLIRGCCSDLKQYKFAYSGRQFDVSGSFGAAYFNSHEQDAKTQLGIVDAACYEAKKSGGGRIHFYNGDDASFETRQHALQVAAKIQTALVEKRFRLYRQPIVALHDDLSGRPDHWEVLVRMLGDNDELIMPSQFLDVAERYSLAPRIDRWVIEETFRWLNATNERDGCAESVNINLSGVSLSDSDFLGVIEQLTPSLDVPTSNVCFEITESASMGKHAKKILFRLKDLGYQLALDDFGTGFSSFGYLESLPVDFIKIDGLFVRDMMHNQSHLEFVKSINDIGKVMGKQTVAEYVECSESLSLLKSIGVDFAQGYQIAQPSPMVRVDKIDRVVEKLEPC